MGVSLISAYQELKRAHEGAVVDGFVGWLNRTNGTKWTVSSRPDPPDAIISDGERVCWVEHADLYRSMEEARSETSLIAPGKEHIPLSSKYILNPDRGTAEALITLLHKKLTLSSYRLVYEKHGQGFLVISERDPLYDSRTFSEIRKMFKNREIHNDKGYFRKIYLAIRRESALVFDEVSYRGVRQCTEPGVYNYSRKHP